jgi:hypothetical protein
MGINLENRIERLENAAGTLPPVVSDAELMNIITTRRNTNNAEVLTADEAACLLTLERMRISGMTFVELVLAAERESTR